MIGLVGCSIICVLVFLAHVNLYIVNIKTKGWRNILNIEKGDDDFVNMLCFAFTLFAIIFPILALLGI